MTILLISAALVLALLGAYARFTSISGPPEEVSDTIEDGDEPHRDDRWGGDW